MSAVWRGERAGSPWSLQGLGEPARWRGACALHHPQHRCLQGSRAAAPARSPASCLDGPTAVPKRSFPTLSEHTK